MPQKSDRERPLEVLVAVEVSAVDVLDVDGDAAGLRVLREDLRALDHAGVARGRDELDREARPARLLAAATSPARGRTCAAGTRRPRSRDRTASRCRSRHGRSRRVPCATICGRLASSRNACRTRTSLNGATSTRIVIGVQRAAAADSKIFRSLRPLDDGHLRERDVGHRLDLAAEKRVDLAPSRRGKSMITTSSKYGWPSRQ